MEITTIGSGGSEWAASSNPSLILRLLRAFALAPFILFLIWSAAALYYDLPLPVLRVPIACLYAIGLLLLSLVVKRPKITIVAAGTASTAVLLWWLTLQPASNRAWQQDVARTPYAVVNGDFATIYNVRNFTYRTETDYTPNWETRSYKLSDIKGLDLFVIHWGSPYIAHVIVSFPFGGNQWLAFSIEARKEIGEDYSSIAGFFRQYELIYLAADERDVVRLRTNYRQHEDTYLFHTVATPERARAILLDYLKRVNRLHQHPEWYNALTSNCTTNIRVHTVATANGNPDPWDWRFLLNGYGAQMLYERRQLAGSLPFQELERRAYINRVARAAGNTADFSRRIREGRPGF